MKAEVDEDTDHVNDFARNRKNIVTENERRLEQEAAAESSMQKDF